MIEKTLDKKRYKRAVELLRAKASDYNYSWDDAWRDADASLDKWTKQ